MRVPIGIDLGTTYSWVIHRGPYGNDRSLESRDGRELTPSVVHFRADGSVTVGEQAKERLAEDGENVVVGIKRQMGQQFALEFGGVEYTPESISGIILRYLAEDAAAQLSTSVNGVAAVITVPAYFGVGEREATFAAAQIAGLECLELVAEPVAAAYAYGLSEEPQRTSLVYDLGGGTFDVAIVGMDRGAPRVWAVDGDTQLGGLDWDKRVEDLLWDQVDALPNADQFRYDDEVMGIIGAASELLKRRLTVQESVTERVYLPGTALKLTVTRNELEEATSDLTLRSMATVDRVISAASAIGAPPVDQILLVGGSTRMPMVRQQLEAHFELPVKLADPDKAVAKGAAVLAAQLVAERSESRPVLLPGAGSSQGPGSGVRRIASVLPRSLGILTYSSGAPLREEPYVRHILHANMPLPIVNSEHVVATVVDNQDRARIQLYEQAGTRESAEPADNRLLVEGEVLGIPPRAAGSPIRLRISVSLDGRITVVSTDGDRVNELEVEAFLHGVLDDNEVAVQKKNVSGLKVV
ncbi:MAG: Hsp70 family protein [Nocardioides sp.]|nr:Hsp70 family protein [Nocardioides sp.]